MRFDAVRVNTESRVTVARPAGPGAGAVRKSLPNIHFRFMRAGNNLSRRSTRTNESVSRARSVRSRGESDIARASTLRMGLKRLDESMGNKVALE